MKQYLDLFRQAHDLLVKHGAPSLNAVRDEAYQWLVQHDTFPTRRCEDYRYTDVAAAFAPNYGLNLSRIDIPSNPYEAFRCDVPNLSSSLYFVINDTLNVKHLPTANMPDGVIVDSLLNANVNIRHRTDNWCVALNTMLAQDGLYIHVPAGVKLDRPIQIINILRSDVELMVNRRVVIDIDEGAEAIILVCDHTADNRRFLVTDITDIRLASNAKLQLYALEENNDKVQRFAQLNVQQAADSHFTHAALTLSCGLSCNRTTVSLDGQGVECNLFGAVIADGQQHADHATLITHRAPSCQSHQLYKYVLDGHAVGAFAGRVLVPHDMQQTVSDMVNANLLGSDTARIYTQPMLEIYADDVQCSHGSTVGQLSDAALIYMRQRGIPEAEARMLLKEAFTSQVIGAIQLPSLRDRLTHLVEKRFRGALAHCEGCKLCN